MPSSNTSSSRLRISDDLAQPLLDVDQLEQLLLLLGLQPQRRRDEVAERARIVDVRRGELELLRQVRDEADDPPEEALHVACERLELLRLLDLVGELDELADEVRVVGDVRSRRTRRIPWTRMRSVPSGTRIILCTTAAVPIS